MMKGDQHSCQAILLLSNAEQLKAIRSEPSQFIKKYNINQERLIQHPLLLNDIIDIGLRPTFFQKVKAIPLTTDLPALAIDTLANLYEDFIDLLAFDRLLPKDPPLEGLQDELSDEPEMKSEEEVRPRQQFKLLSYIHLGIIEDEPEEVSYYYLSRLIGPLCYQRPVELMNFYQAKPQMLKVIIDRMDHRPIVEIFCKILQSQSGKQFFKEYKYKYLHLFFERIRKALKESQQQNWLEGLHQIYRFFTEKMEEPSDRNKYQSLLEKVSELELVVLQEINRNVLSSNEESCFLCLKWVEELLKHDGYVIGQNHQLSLTIMNRKNSISNNFYHDEKVDFKYKYHLSEPHLRQIVQFCQKIDLIYLSEERRGCCGQILIIFFRVLYFLARIWNHKTKDKQMKNPEFILQMINQKFIDNTLVAVFRHPHNTSFHNYAKEVIIECIRQGILAPAYFYIPEGTYSRLLLESYPKSRKNLGSPFSQQIFYIYKEVIAVRPHVSPQIEAIISQQSQRLSKLIAGDPRKLQSDNLRGSSNAYSESSENMEEIMQFDLNSQNSLGSIGSGKGVIKVHASTSLECEVVQAVRIMASEGAEEG